MITIKNTSHSSAPIFGPHQYELKVNGIHFVEFTHLKQPRALSTCLRDAANAIDAAEELSIQAGIDEIEELET